MTIEEIEKFLNTSKTDNEAVRISFKKRDAMNGLFIKDRDFNDLKSKNFWRIVPQSQLESYSQSKNVNLAKIYSGSDFAKLAVLKAAV
jgi:hypothetical protein